MKKSILLFLAGAISLSSYAIGPITGPTSTCVGIGWQVTVTDVTTGGTYTSSDPTVATVVAGTLPGTGVVTGIKPGYVTISYSCACGGVGTETATMTFIVNSPTSITGDNTVCDGNILHLTGSPAGGQWTTTAPTTAIIDPVFTFSTDAYVKFVSTGDAAIYYTKGGCYTILDVTSNPSPMCIVGNSTVKCGCSCSETFTCASPGGVWSTSNPSIATISSSGVVTCHAEGCVDVIYTLNGCSVSKTINVTTHDHRDGSAISGNVSNNTGGSVNPEPYMNVNVMDPSTGLVLMSTTTDGSGNYSLTNIPDGTYSVAPAQSGYTSTSSTVTIGSTNLTASADFVKNTSAAKIAPKTTGVVTVATVKNIDVYPNPTTGILNIKWQNQDNGNAMVVVADVTGRVVFNSAIEINTVSGQSALDLSSLENGMYIMSVKSADINYTGKVLINK